MRRPILHVLGGLALAAAGCSVPDTQFHATPDAPAHDAMPDAQPALALVVTPATLSLDVDEAGTTTFTVALNHAPAAPVHVTIDTTSKKIGLSDSSFDFDDQSWSAARTITVSGVDDPDTRDETAAIQLAATGGVLDAVTVTAHVHDDDVLAVVTDLTGSDLHVAEGQSLDLNVSLSAEPDADVTVRADLDTGPVSAFPSQVQIGVADWNQPHKLTLSTSQDSNTITEQVALHLRDPAGTAMERSFVVYADDDDVQGIVVTPTSLNVNEGGPAVALGISLRFQPSAPVTLDLSTLGIAQLSATSVMLTTTDWSQVHTVDVSAPADPDTADASDTITLSGGGLTKTVPVTLHDLDKPTIVVSPATTQTITERTSKTVGVSLAYKPPGTVRVLITSDDTKVATVSPGFVDFTPNDYDQPVDVTITGASDPDLTTESTTVHFASTGFTGVDLGVTVPDADTQTITLSKTMMSLTEPNSGTFTAVLGYDPGGSVDLAIASGNPSLGVSPTKLTFDHTNYTMPQTVTVTALSDPDAVSFDTTVNVSGAGAQAKSVAVHVTDDDVLAIETDLPDDSHVPENGSLAMQVRLTAQPTGDVHVSASLGAGPITVSPSTRTFTTANWHDYQTFTFYGTDDANADSESVALTWQADDPTIPDKGMTLITDDDDVLDIRVQPTAVAVTEGQPGAAVQVSMTAAPSTTTIVTVAPQSGLAAVDKTQLQFSTTNWSNPQTVTITAPSDNDTVGGTTSVSLTSGTLSKSVTVNVTDDDVQAIMQNAGTSIAASEGTATTFDVWLQWDPLGPVQLDLSSLDTGVATVSPASVSFDSSNYNQHKTITVTGVHDQNLVANSTSIKIADHAAVIPSVTVPVTVADVDHQVILLAPASVSVNEGSTGTFTCKLQYDPGGAVTVNLASSDPTALPIDKASLPFDSSNYATAKTVTVSAPVDSNTTSETATITASGASAPTPATIMASVVDKTVVADYGWPTYFGATTTVGGGNALAYQFSVPQNTTLDKFFVYTGSAGGSAKMAIYSNAAGGVPGSPIAKLDVGASLGVAGANPLDLGDVALPTGTYWLVIRVSPNASIGHSTTVTAPFCLKTVSNFTDNWPDPFNADSCSSSGSGALNMWIATYHQ